MLEIPRRELPGWERKGAQAQVVIGPEILVITLHQARVDVETQAGVAADVPESLRKLEAGVSDTVLLGSHRQGSVALLDVLMVERRSYRGKSWKDRLAVLGKLYDRMPAEFKASYRLATVKRKGLMKAFDENEARGGVGLLLRVEGQSKAVFCNRR
jgi:hypothetical protein